MVLRDIRVDRKSGNDATSAVSSPLRIDANTMRLEDADSAAALG